MNITKIILETKLHILAHIQEYARTNKSLEEIILNYLDNQYKGLLSYETKDIIVSTLTKERSIDYGAENSKR